MAGTFGYELNVNTLTQAETNEIQEQVRQYKKYEELIRQGRYYRLSNPFTDNYAAWMFAAEDKSRALFNIVMLENHSNMEISVVKLKGLEADAVYEDEKSGRRYDGAALMAA